LACGEPNTIAWKIINAYADNFISIPDESAARAMRVLGNPLAGDERILSGESGGAGFAAFYAAMMQKELADLKHKLRIDENSVLLFVNTEGNTDEENYRKIVWC
ncbi:MAG: diaminopropionate ammonia-lyase, partial [Acutalibacteraceae bacterium]